MTAVQIASNPITTGFVIFNLAEFKKDGCGFWNKVAGWTILAHAEVYPSRIDVPEAAASAQLISTGQARALESAWENSHVLSANDYQDIPTRPLFRRFGTYADWCALSVLAAHRLGLEPMHMDNAMKVLNTGPNSVHPLILAALEREFVRLNELIRKTSMTEQANAHLAELRKRFMLVVKPAPRILFANESFSLEVKDQYVEVKKQGDHAYIIPVSNPWFDRALEVDSEHLARVLYDALVAL